MNIEKILEQTNYLARLRLNSIGHLLKLSGVLIQNSPVKLRKDDARGAVHLYPNTVYDIKTLYEEYGATENNICQKKSTRQIVQRCSE